MTPDRRERIERAIAQVEAAGEAVTNDKVRRHVPDGSTADFKAYMKARRAQRRDETATATMAEPNPEPPPPLQQGRRAPALGTLLSLPPLQQAEQTLLQAVAAEALAQQRYRALLADQRETLATIRVLRGQANAARSQAARAPLHAARRVHEEVAAQYPARLEDLADLRNEANRAMLDAQQVYTEVLKRCQRAWYRLHAARLDQARGDETGELSAEERAARAFAELASLVGDAEAQQLQVSGQRPPWLGQH